MPETSGDISDTLRSLEGIRLAVLAPLSFSVPPRAYGPWEQVASTIVEGMVKRGLDVTLFASGDSQTSAKLEYILPQALDRDRTIDYDVAIAIHIARVFERANDFDLVHNNLDWKPLTYALATPTPPMLTTIHGFSSPTILAAYYAAAQRSFYCSISNADRDPGLDYVATTYNGVDVDSFTYRDRPGDYLAFMARFHPEKGAHLAIEIAKRAGIRLIMAGIPQDEEYYRNEILPHIDNDRVVMLGEVAGEERNRLLGEALALVHMTTRPERFGLSLIEAGACGTPVLGARMGSLPEIVIDGTTGFLAETVDEAVGFVAQLPALDRRKIREHIASKFSTDAMIDRYIRAYAAVLADPIPKQPTQKQREARLGDWWQRAAAFTVDPPRPTMQDAYAKLITP